MATDKGNRNARGYGKAHKKRREHEARNLRRYGQVPCARCGLPIFATWPLNPPEPHAPKCAALNCEGSCWVAWDLGHTDDRDGYNGPEHRSCNRSAGGLNAAAAARKPAPPVGRVFRDYGW